MIEQIGAGTSYLAAPFAASVQPIELYISRSYT
jgi:hypothetical protein